MSKPELIQCATCWRVTLPVTNASSDTSKVGPSYVVVEGGEAYVVAFTMADVCAMLPDATSVVRVGPSLAWGHDGR